MYQTYERKLEQIEKRYPGMEPKTILKKLLGSDTLRDEEQVLPSRSVPVTGEQGGRLLACHLYSLEQAGEGRRAQAQELTRGSRLSSRALRSYYPAQKLCLQKALQFLPKLKECLAARASAEDEDTPPEPLFDSDDDSFLVALGPGAGARTPIVVRVPYGNSVP